MAFQISQRSAEPASERPMVADWGPETSSSSSDRLCTAAFGTTTQGESGT
jgi:hypothetical protein